MEREATWEEVLEEDRRIKAEQAKRKRRTPEAEPESDHAKTLARMVEVEQLRAKEADLERSEGIRDNSSMIQAVLS